MNRRFSITDMCECIFIYLLIHNFYYTSLVGTEFAVGIIPATLVNSSWQTVCMFEGWVDDV